MPFSFGLSSPPPVPPGTLKISPCGFILGESLSSLRVFMRHSCSAFHENRTRVGVPCLSASRLFHFADGESQRAGVLQQLIHRSRVSLLVARKDPQVFAVWRSYQRVLVIARKLDYPVVAPDHR